MQPGSWGQLRTRIASAGREVSQFEIPSRSTSCVTTSLGRIGVSLAQEDGPAIKQTPAMAAGIGDHVWTAQDIAGPAA